MSDEVLAPKPAPDLYVRGIRLVRDIASNNIAPEQVLAIEDTYVGVLAAQRAGCRVIVPARRKRMCLSMT
jgi:HAD superfamily hydrolase (TIGR01509 family)